MTLEGRISINSDGDEIYFLNEFDRELIVYDRSLILKKIFDLNKIITSGIPDNFISFSKKINYLTVSGNNMIYILDDNYRIRDQIDMMKNRNININRSIYPVGHDSFIFSDNLKKDLYLLKNKRISNIVSADIPFNDFYFSSDSLFVLSGEKIFLYNEKGIMLSKMDPGKKGLTDISYNKGNIYLADNDSVYEFSISNKRIRSLFKNKYSDFLIDKPILYYSNRDSLKYRILDD